MRVNRMSRWLLLCVFAVAWPAVAPAQERDLGRFFDDFTAEWVRRDPDLATATRFFSGAEQDRMEQQLTPNTRAWALERIALARRGLRDLDKFDTAKLDESQRLSAQLMHWMLDSVVRSEQYMDYRFPLDQFGGANVQLVETLTLRHPLAAEKDASNYVKRLTQVGQRMDEVVGRGEASRRRGHDPAGVHHQDHARLDAHVPRCAGGAEPAGHRAGAEDGRDRRDGARAAHEAAGRSDAARRRRGLSGVGPRDQAARIDPAEGDRRRRPVALQRRRRGVRILPEPVHDYDAHAGADPPDRPEAGGEHRRSRWTRS